MHRYPGGTTKSLTIAQEPLTGIAFPDQRLMLISELIPQSMKLLIVWPNYIVAKLMEHCIRDLLDR